jgi:hypothetical protein
MSDVNDTDITGLEFQVTNQDDKQANALSEDEWYLTKLSGITKKKNNTPGWPDQLSWVFELVGDEYKYSWQGKDVQRVVYGSTSLVFSAKSKAYLWYAKMTGKEPIEGDKISLTPLIGRQCFVMVKKHVSKANKTSYIVEKVKHKEQTVVPENPAAVAPKPVTPAAPAATVAQQPPKQATPAPVAAGGDLFKDIF